MSSRLPVQVFNVAVEDGLDRCAHLMTLQRYLWAEAEPEIPQRWAR